MFKCSKCGICCKHIELVEELSIFNRGDGVCIHLVNNLCDIYESRPDICNVEVMYEKVYKRFYSKEEFYKINEDGCKKIIKLHNDKLGGSARLFHKII